MKVPPVRSHVSWKGFSKLTLQPRWCPEELERRPEFAPAGGSKLPAQYVEPRLSGPSKPAASVSAVPAENDRSRAGTPLRSVNEGVANESVNITMNENFDAEFLDESFFGLDGIGDETGASEQAVPIQ